MKKILLSTLAISITWFVLDFLIHGLALMEYYEQTKNLWRPMEEIQANWWTNILSVVSAFVFSWTYCCNVSNKSVKTGLSFGTKIGVIFGLSMGFGMYAVMPIPMILAIGWFLAAVISLAAAGCIASSIITCCECPGQKLN